MVLTPVDLLAERFERVARGQESGKTVAILLAEIDGLPHDDDNAQQHRTAAALLKAIAGRLSTLLRPGDSLARVSDSKIIIFCENLDNRSTVRELANRIDAALNGVFHLGEERITVSASLRVVATGNGDEMPVSVVQDQTGIFDRAKRGNVSDSHIIDLTGEGVTSHPVSGS